MQQSEHTLEPGRAGGWTTDRRDDEDDEVQGEGGGAEHSNLLEYYVNRSGCIRFSIFHERSAIKSSINEVQL